MVRHAATEAAQLARPGDRRWCDTFVLGHGDGDDGQATTDRRLAFLPLPSVERRRSAGGAAHDHIGLIRRVLVVGPPGAAADVGWVRRALSGRELTDQATGRPAAVLSVLPSADPHLTPYTRPSAAWSTVTPVVLPGRDQARAAKAERLLRKAIAQAGFSETLARCAEVEWRGVGFLHHWSCGISFAVACAEVEWRGVGFLPGVEPATRYELPAHLNGLPRYHVRLRWRDAAGRPVEVRGPVALGAGRYGGLGLFVAGR